jgi:hypothetical protein
VSERYDEALDELRTLAHEIRREGSDSGYGYFPGGDPRDFSPDPDASTEAERTAHKVACDAWDRGERPVTPGPHEHFQEGETNGWITRSFFGLGVYNMEDPDLLAWADTIERCVERLENE